MLKIIWLISKRITHKCYFCKFSKIIDYLTLLQFIDLPDLFHKKIGCKAKLLYVIYLKTLLRYTIHLFLEHLVFILQKPGLSTPLQSNIDNSYFVCNNKQDSPTLKKKNNCMNSQFLFRITIDLSLKRWTNITYGV